ncbi:Glucosamine-phosphate N-acetyltransferase-like protein [Savitreella phatthalungensis]
MTDLFDPSLLEGISLTDVRRPGTEHLRIRPLRSTDHEIGYLTVLDALVPSALTKDVFTRQFELMKACRPAVYYIVVVEDTRESQILATATLLVEHKFLRAGARAGHIEDVSVRSTAQGLGLGKLLITTLTAMATSDKLGCYKVILDCSEANVPFYQKCGYLQGGIEMKYYAAERS